jgi:hypothetical protein
LAVVGVGVFDFCFFAFGLFDGGEVAPLVVTVGGRRAGFGGRFDDDAPRQGYISRTLPTRRPQPAIGAYVTGLISGRFRVRLIE